MDGKNRTIFVEANGNTIRKYFLDDVGAKMDLAEFLAKRDASTRNSFGKLGVRLAKVLEKKAGGDFLEVDLLPSYPEPVGSLPGGKLTKIEFQEHRRKLKGRLSKAVGIALARTNTDLSMGDDFLAFHRVRVTKREIDRLLKLPDIGAINLPILNPRTVPEGSYREIFRSSTVGIEQVLDDNSLRVGVWERKEPVLAGILGGGWYYRRPGFAACCPNVHGTEVAAIIRNLSGTDMMQFEMGGSPQSLIHFSFPLYGETDHVPSYDWLLQHGVRVINWSWAPGRWLDYENLAYGWELDRLTDYYTANYPYVLNVGSSGNTGGPGPGGENLQQQCVQESSIGWDETACSRVSKWGHNSLIVGSVNLDGSRSPFSSYANGEMNNEAPHVVALGNNIEGPWMKPYNEGTYLWGTSFSAPAISSLANNLIANYPALSNYPEAVKALIMASGRVWPNLSGSSTDFQVGFGRPDGLLASNIARNKDRLNGEFGTSYGYTTFSFPSSSGAGAELSFDVKLSAGAPDIQYFDKFLVTWVSTPPSYIPWGQPYPTDDVNIIVTQVPTNTVRYGYSSRNSTEVVAFNNSGKGVKDVMYRVVVKSYSKRSTGPIHGALVWKQDTQPMQ